MTDAPIQKAVRAFRDQGGLLRTREALKLGIHPRTLYRMRDAGIISQVSRGIYRLASMQDLTQPDLVTVAVRVPRAIVCLVSALAFHEATTEIPHEVYIALPRRTKVPRVEHPPLRIFWFSGPSLSEGIEVTKIDGVQVRIYNLPKTVVDCFRFRNKIGIDVAVEALNEAIRRKGVHPAEVLRYARACRVEAIILPYLEAIQ